MSNPSPVTLHNMLYRKYAGSQTYFYSNKINQITRQKRTTANIFYEDVEYLLDFEENLKRWYQEKEYHNKMFTFKEYYFYHQDCPRVFQKGIQDLYSKWQDRRRDLVYKKLKLLYNQSVSSSFDSRNEQPSKNQVGVTHFLLDISEYNPYSKKYYLRVEARRQKQRLKVLQERKQQQSKRDLQHLNHQLSNMLNDMSLLSDISTLSTRNPQNDPFQKYKSTKLSTITKKTIDKTNSTSLSTSNSLVKFNFKKKNSLQKIRSESKELKVTQSKQKNTKRIDNRSNSKDVEKIQLMPDNQKLSPKHHPAQAQLLKSKSIFSVSSFGPLYKTNQMPHNHNRKELLKIQTDNKPSSKGVSRYESEKKDSSKGRNLIVKAKSTSKLEPQFSTQKVRRDGSQCRLVKKDEFSDKRMSVGQPDVRLRSFKSEFAPSKKQNFAQLKPTFQIKKSIHLVERGKRILQLKS